MTVERALRLMAGVVILVSVALVVLHSHWWLVLTGAVGLNLLQSAVSGWCPAMWVFEKLGMSRCDSSVSA